MKTKGATVLIASAAASAYNRIHISSHASARHYDNQRCRPSCVRPRNALMELSTTRLTMSSLMDWWKETNAMLQLSRQGENVPLNQDPDLAPQSQSVATVVRTASRKYNAKSSTPSTRSYTTRKDAKPFLKVTQSGAKEDYNHYRTVALKSTPDRALSILTRDTMELIRSQYSQAQDGDLGENLLVQGVSWDFFEIGQQYQFLDETVNDAETVVVEITQPVVPCANLCKLPYINDERLSAKERIEKCQEFIEKLDQVDGLRGWYAKVIHEGVISVGDRLTRVADEKPTKELNTSCAE